MSTLRNKITAQQIDDLYNRRITSTALAKILGVSLSHLSRSYRDKCAHEKLTDIAAHKKDLIATRKKFRETLARQVISGQITLQDGAETARIHIRTMRRVVNKCLKTST